MRFTLFIAAFVLGTTAHAQLFMPRDIESAYKKQTRSNDGKPGKNYWQNRASYKISITALPPDRNVKGTENITYVNNSPDTLKSLTIKLFLNVHKPGAPRDFGVQDDYLTSGMHIDALSVNGQKLNGSLSLMPSPGSH